jgi:plastocyanin
MRFQHKNGLVALMLAIMIFVITACSSAMKEDYATASNTEQSDTIQAPSDSVTPSTESAYASTATATATASEPAAAEPSVQPSDGTKVSESPSPVAEESHHHDSSPKPSPKPSESTPSPEPSKESAKETKAADQAVIVEIKDFAFSPDKVTIRKGSTVTFINRDKIKHTATADGGEFDTGLLGKDVSGKVKFDETGTFTYYCSPHPGMTGTIVVEDK